MIGAAYEMGIEAFGSVMLRFDTAEELETFEANKESFMRVVVE